MFMTHTNLLKFSFSYDERFGIPLVPINFFYKDGTPTQPFNNAILDSGASEITIPKMLADLLELELKPRSRPAQTAGGEVEAYIAKTDFNLGRGGRVIKYNDTEICVMEKCPAILVGINPIFNDYKVTIMAYKNRFTLEPRK
jgi:predicted aspartyl protease